VGLFLAGLFSRACSQSRGPVLVGLFLAGLFSRLRACSRGPVSRGPVLSLVGLFSWAYSQSRGLVSCAPVLVGCNCCVFDSLVPSCTKRPKQDRPVLLRRHGATVVVDPSCPSTLFHEFEKLVSEFRWQHLKINGDHLLDNPLSQMGGEFHIILLVGFSSHYLLNLYKVIL
jgi:hypothetical protein